MTRLGALFVEEPRVFDGDARFAREDAHQFEMSFIKRTLVLRKNGHDADGMVIRDERNAAEAALLENRLGAEFFNFGDEVLANQHGLPRSYDVLREIVAGRPAPRRP